MPITPTPPPAGPLAHWLAHPGSIDARLFQRIGHALAVTAHGWWPLAVACCVVLAACAVAVEVADSRRGQRGRWLAIAPPAEPDPAGGPALWRMLDPLLTARHGLSAPRPPVAFECHSDATGLRIGIWVSRTLPITGVTRAIESAWPGARAKLSEPPEVATVGRISGGRARLAGPDWLPLGTDAAGGDPLRGLLATLVAASTDGPGGGGVLFQVLARPARGMRVNRARRAARARRRGLPTTAVGRTLDVVHNQPASQRNSASTDPMALADVRDITAKVIAAPHFEVAVRYAVASTPGMARRDDRRLRRARGRQIAAALGLYAGRNHLVARRLLRPRNVASRRLRHGFLLSLPELAALAHLPTEPAGYGLPAAPARTVAPPPEVAHA